MRRPGRFCGAKVVEPLRSSPLGLEPGCTLSKQQQQQQQLNKRSSPDSPQNSFRPRFCSQLRSTAAPRDVGLCPHNLPRCLLGGMPLPGTLHPGRVLLPSTQISLPDGFCPSFSNNYIFSQKIRPGLGSAPGWEYCQGRLPCRVRADVLSWLGGHLCEHDPAFLTKTSLWNSERFGTKKP